jgi:hypothetical protein
MRIAAEFVDFFNPQSNPQTMMSCATSAYFGSPRGLVSCCKTYSCCSDKGEVGGSSPPRPTIQNMVRPGDMGDTTYLRHG